MFQYEDIKTIQVRTEGQMKKQNAWEDGNPTRLKVTFALIKCITPKEAYISMLYVLNNFVKNIYI